LKKYSEIFGENSRKFWYKAKLDLMDSGKDSGEGLGRFGAKLG
jgi:hypothetical protein